MARDVQHRQPTHKGGTMKVTRTKKGITLRLSLTEAADLQDVLMLNMTWAEIKEPQRFRLVVALWEKLFNTLKPEA